MKAWAQAALALLVVSPATHALERRAPDACTTAGLNVQVLGSGGPELAEGRAGAAYLIWIDGRARVLVDAGPGTALRFAASGARVADLDLVLFTHLHMDHTLDLPAFAAQGLRDGRTRPLAIYGPTGNRLAPSTVTFVRTLLDGTRGAYRHLGAVLSPLVKNGFKLEPQDVRLRPSPVGVRRDDSDIIDMPTGAPVQAAATYVVHGGYPALAWRVRVGERTVVFSGDTNGEGGTLERLAHAADLFVAHHAVAEGAGGVERYAHMPPAVIGRVAAESGVKRVLLSHRTPRTLGAEEASLAAIRTRYAGPVVFADDLDCFAVP